MKAVVYGQLFPSIPLCSRELEALLLRLLAVLCLDGDVSLSCVDDQEIAELNERFLGCIGPTNILSFPSAEGLGELVLSREALFRESILYGQPLGEHLIRLLAHGLLHLAGLEHGPEMFERTELAVQHCASLVEVIL